MLVGISLLIISASILLYHYPPATWRLDFAGSSTPPSKDPRTPPPPQANQASSSDTPRNQDTSLKATGREAVGSDGVSHRPVDSQAERSPSPETTPKAIPVSAKIIPPVPSFSLQDDESSEEEDNAPPPSFPALNSAQRASAPPVKGPSMGPPPSLGPPQFKAPSIPSRPSSMPSSLMPPPSAPRLPQSNASSLRIPSSGPLPNRGPPGAAGSIGGGGAGGLSPSLAGTVKTPNPRAKVQLRPGYSPLDWATLLKSGQNLSGVSSLVRVTPSMLKYNNGRKGRPAWSSYMGRVYNITPYVPFHPGGEGELRRAAGKDGGKLFMEVHPWVNWENMLGECVVGIMVAENEGAASNSSGLDEMD